jgi:hypothetical protein
VGNSRGACKLARTPHENQKKKQPVKEYHFTLDRLGLHFTM